MSDVKHTPGPWTLGDENNYHCEVCIGETICSMTRDTPFSEKYVISREEMLANAHLIMAAPDLLAFAKHVVNSFPFGSTISEMAVDVINKAEPGYKDE